MLDTIQDLGRQGYQHLGINTNGAMDRFAARLANGLLGKDLAAPVIEMHFPAAAILFEKPTIICITGADFSPVINYKPLPINHPIAVNKNSLLQFTAVKSGARCYIATAQDLQIDKWLNSYSTNLIAAAGGFNGRALQKEDRISYKDYRILNSLFHGKDVIILPWTIGQLTTANTNEIKCVQGSEWNCLTHESKLLFQKEPFQISTIADRMGYRLTGRPLKIKEEISLLSSAVNFGTVQLLPNGKLIILMADHQTTGGYPKIAHVISAHLPVLAQMTPHQELTFAMTDMETAEGELFQQHKYLQQLQNTCKLKMESFYNANLRS